MDKLVVDCATGKTTVEPLSAKELKQVEKDAAEAEKREKAENERRAKHDEVLDKLAAAAGVTVEDLRVALR